MSEASRLQIPTFAMSFVNSYKPPAPRSLADVDLYGPEPYDVNYIFPLRPEGLESDRVKLVPFIPREHAAEYWKYMTQHPDLLRYYPFALHTFEEYLNFWETSIRSNPSNVMFAIYDKTRHDPEHPERGGSLAGVTGLFYSSDANLCAEIAYVVIFPPFQRTHVASNMVGVLLRYCLELPTASNPGLGLRRVQWCAHEKNTASARLAERMGMKREGIIRWHWVLPEILARDGLKPGENDMWPEKYGRHAVVLSMCWDDWEGGGREHVERQIARV